MAVYGLLMPSPISDQNRYVRLIYRPFWGAMLVLLAVLSIALAVLINSSWQALQRTEPLQNHLALMEALRSYHLKLDSLKSAFTLPPTTENNARISQLLPMVMGIQQGYSTVLSSHTETTLAQTINTLQTSEGGGPEQFQQLENSILIALDAETSIQNHLLRLLARDNRLELETATSIALALPLLGLLILFFMRHRILRPLNDLGLLINQLGRRALPPVPLSDIDPLLKPLFIDFNSLLQRLSELERAQQQHQRQLEDKVRHATQSLLEYHHTLAQSERLAAVGEITARLAHELRNPLAGIHMALSNLRSESDGADTQARLTMVLDELDRITTLLNEVLGQSRHAPEPASDFNLAASVTSLLQLARYQIAATITIEQNIAPTIQCHLPQGRMRQALLNLILNAAQSIAGNRGHITISATTDKQQLCLRVQDDGPGLPESLLNNGVRPFATSRQEGTGLGLAIVHRFCHDQGGELILSNQPDGGACIQLNLPHAT